MAVISSETFIFNGENFIRKIQVKRTPERHAFFEQLYRKMGQLIWAIHCLKKDGLITQIADGKQQLRALPMP